MPFLLSFLAAFLLFVHVSLSVLAFVILMILCYWRELFSFNGSLVPEHFKMVLKFSISAEVDVCMCMWVISVWWLNLVLFVLLYLLWENNLLYKLPKQKATHQTNNSGNIFSLRCVFFHVLIIHQNFVWPLLCEFQFQTELLALQIFCKSYILLFNRISL